MLLLAACATRPVGAPPPLAPARAVAANPSPPSAPVDYANVMVRSATAMLGQPYRYGGAAPGGFDCSGLVSYAAARAGIAVPRTAHEQLQSGSRIARGELRAGDLVFMRLAHKELHVGIALDNMRFIHAPSAGGRVRIDSLGAAPYASGFIAARRVIE